MEFNEIQIVILISSLVLLTVLGIAIALFVFFQKKKLSFILREKEQEKKYEETLTKSQIEIRENALKNIAWELHDNIGQLLTLARIRLNVLQQKSVNNALEIEEISNVIGNSLNEIRSISKILNEDVINNLGLEEAIQIEIDRFNRLKYIESYFHTTGNPITIPAKDEIILFRIIQEFFSNTIKYAQADKLYVKIDYHPEKVKILVKDNGKGFDPYTVKKGSGLINIHSRAALINTKITLKSNSGGTQLHLNYPVKTSNHEKI